MKKATININDCLWWETLQQLRHDVYHFPQYVSLEAQRTNSIAKAFIIKDEDKVFFIPYLLRSCQDVLKDEKKEKTIFDIVSPYGYPGILLSKTAEEDIDFANYAFSKFKESLLESNVCSAFIRLHPILCQNLINIFDADNLVDQGQTVSINLTLDKNNIWAKTRRGHQSTINKCKRLGLKARRVNFADYFEEFIAIYYETMNRVNAKDGYYFGRDYFRNLLSLGEHIHLGIVEAEKEIVCASLFFESGGIVQAHLGGTKTDFMKQSPFNLLLHFMSLWAKDRGNEYLHIGGGVGGKKDNLFTFKSGFSKQRHQFYTLRLIIDETSYQYLTIEKAKYLNKSHESSICSDFFPAYRAN